ncbi:polysaccharide biosynthesis/export family protein, partial [Sulfurovum sp.]|uniref:polysaccharide biosynthesis/export family protein n=1 Tax=Sulfurovum sp. TaxID=1969726 RepID=UPI0025E6E211
MKRIVMYLMLALAMAGCSSKENYILFNKAKVTSPDANKSITRLHNVRYEYRIQPHDRISITMYNHPELGTSSVQSQKQDTRGVLVDSRGFIRLPLVKSVHIAGLTQTAAQEKIERAFK